MAVSTATGARKHVRNYQRLPFATPFLQELSIEQLRAIKNAGDNIIGEVENLGLPKDEVWVRFQRQYPDYAAVIQYIKITGGQECNFIRDVRVPKLPLKHLGLNVLV